MNVLIDTPESGGKTKQRFRAPRPPKVQLSIQVPEEMRAEICKRAEISRISISTFVREVLEEALAR